MGTPVPISFSSRLHRFVPGQEPSSALMPTRLCSTLVDDTRSSAWKKERSHFRDRPRQGPQGRARSLSMSQPASWTGGLAADDDPYLGLIGVVSLRDMADALEDYQVQRARQAGFTWAQIAAALGVSPQAAHKKHAGRLASQGTLPPEVSGTAVTCRRSQGPVTQGLPASRSPDALKPPGSPR